MTPGCNSDSVDFSQQEDWPEDFWKAFEDMPEDFERPAQVKQWREIIDSCSTSG